MKMEYEMAVSDYTNPEPEIASRIPRGVYAHWGIYDNFSDITYPPLSLHKQEAIDVKNSDPRFRGRKQYRVKKIDKGQNYGPFTHGVDDGYHQH